MDQQQLELLYQKLVVQAPYPGDVCPTEQNLAEAAAGSLPQQEQARIEAHLLTCPDCQRVREQLDAASAWFRENEAQIHMGLLDKAISDTVRPWDSCLSEDVLEQYLRQTIPDTPAGARLKGSIESHLDGCSTCRGTVERLKAHLAKPWFASLLDLAQQTDDAVRAALREMVEGLKSVALARGVPSIARAMPGFRGQPARTVSAILLDSEGKMTLDAESRPQRVEFCLIRAQLDRDGTVVLELSTVDPQIQDVSDSEFLLSVVLHYEHRRLIFPTERISQKGHVIMVGNLVPGIQIGALPTCAIRLTLHRVARNPRPV